MIYLLLKILRMESISIFYHTILKALSNSPITDEIISTYWYYQKHNLLLKER